jgi:hypothetical protein
MATVFHLDIPRMLVGRKSKQIDIKDKCFNSWHSKEGGKYGTTIFFG